MRNTKKKHCKYGSDKITFRKKKQLGSGGNGTVFRVELIEGSESLKQAYPYVDVDKLAVKFFSVRNRQPKQIKEERYKRFCEEVKRQGELGKEISGVIPILDYNCPLRRPAKGEEAWYLMPEAKPFQVSEDGDLCSKLSLMLELAKVIRQVHNRGIMHRDIKPDNIFYYNEKICLGDFGLLWTADRELLTESGERVGPIKILPPELEQIEQPVTCDYKASDTYLFAKVLWMFVKKESYGFRGEYNRGEPQIYLNKTQCGIQTLEPLHTLLESATRNDWRERATLEECIGLIERQIAICENRIDPYSLKLYTYQEENSYFMAVKKADRKIYVQYTDIYDYLKNTIRHCELRISRGAEKYVIVPLEIKRTNRELVVITELIGGLITKEYLLDIERLELGGDCPTLYTKKFEIDDNGYLSVSSLNQIDYNMTNKIAFDDTYIITMVISS